MMWFMVSAPKKNLFSSDANRSMIFSRLNCERQESKHYMKETLAWNVSENGTHAVRQNKNENESFVC